jgi:hypothetical protein
MSEENVDVARRWFKEVFSRDRALKRMKRPTHTSGRYGDTFISERRLGRVSPPLWMHRKRLA